MARTQGSFSALTIFATTNDEHLTTYEDSFELNIKKSLSGKDEYVPVNLISDEVYAMIAAWEALSLSATKGLDDSEDLASKEGTKTSFDPIRRMQTLAPPNLAPPARFQRSPKKIH